MSEKHTLPNATDTGHIHVGKGLNTGALGVVGSTVIGLASTAPLYSLAATLGYVIVAVGAQAPLVFIVACIPMIFAPSPTRSSTGRCPTAARPSCGAPRPSAP